ncbi:MAG: lantibiotic dehydratase [Deltaproteobacteria bacterium]|nr:lantibiotic dehydratase [Deltaproteobacteria bacterium]
MGDEVRHVLLAGGWCLWRDVLVRGAGFELGRALALASPQATLAAEALLDAEAAAEDALDPAIAAAQRGHASTTGDERHAWARVLKGLRKGQLDPHPPAASIAATPELAKLGAALASYRERMAAFEQRWAAAELELDEVLRAAAKAPDFREAVLWQNRAAVRDGLDVLAQASPGSSDSRTRKKQLLVASYLQRYCTKNDMIGFFGPSAWARFADGGPAIAVREPSGDERRVVAFEPWAVAALADALVDDPAIRRRAPPRLRADLWLSGDSLLGLDDGPVALEEADLALLTRCDGVRPAQQVLQESGVGDGEVRLRSALERGWLTWEIPVAIEGEPERQLRTLVGEGNAALEEVLGAKREVAAACGDAAKLGPALEHLEQVFVTHARAASTRGHGQTYAGRTLVYHDVLRPLEMDLGQALREQLAAPLSLLLESARWFTWEIARRFREAARAAHARLASQAGARVPLAALWKELSGALYEQPSILDAVAEELRSRWDALLEAPAAEEGQVIRLSSSDLAAGVARAFEAAAPGWPSARHHAPDVLVAASSAEAMARGELELVLGEIHAGVNTYTTLSVLEPCDRVEVLRAAWKRDHPQRGIGSIPNEAFARSTLDSRLAQEHLHLDLGGRFGSPRGPGSVVSAGELVAEPDGGESLRVLSRDGRYSFDLVEVFDRTLRVLAAPRFAPFDSEGSLPRLTLDRLVVRRARWCFATEALEFATFRHRRDRFLGARRWRREQRLPRFVFAKSPAETKPFFVDLESPVLVDLLAKAARAAPTLALTEMLPAPDQVWLRDRRGGPYTSELRLIAVDDKAWGPPR